jgi:hypothetical protein
VNSPNKTAEPAHRPNPYKLALGLLKHPDRQHSGAGHAGRSVKQMELSVFVLFFGFLACALAGEPSKIELPVSLSHFYVRFVTAGRSGDPARIKSFLLPGAVEINLTPRTGNQEYGTEINVPFMKDRFSDQIVLSRKDSNSAYLIRTGTSYISCVETASDGWKIFLYGDKPIQ